MKPIIALTPGDFNGIGPEVLLKAALRLPDARYRLIAPLAWLESYARQCDLEPELTSFRDTHEVYWPDTLSGWDYPGVLPGQLDADCGRIAMESIDTAINQCLSGQAQAMVTAPISKEAIQLAGYTVPGHTEFLAERTGTRHYTMMLVRQNLRVGLVTTHIPVRNVADAVTHDSIVSHLNTMHRALQRQFNIASPGIAVLGLNPHAGDGGVLGTEEIDIIHPAIIRARSMGIHCEGPFPADGFFGSGTYKSFDAVLAMYHDQGLAPFKALSFGGGVNFTAGLPIIRTSPDHGTAFAIAGRKQADEQSMLEAVNMAIELAVNH
ncbi:MAG: 4-hydroxythreonine-4-phosphate dehydrogenase PdxA [Bacteroidetes bacterium HLUCCA01]|nr:MAG: 4-hydroxythreonine-4-phosphate dehydrogenase PdxA [Bacteroidetes bacterium HLUCCA01]